MISRYSRPEMSRIWSDENRLRIFLRVETAFLEVLARDKKIPAAELKRLKNLPRGPLLADALKRERSSGHEIVGLLGAISSALGARAPGINRYLHYGLTSSDILDTALAVQLRDSADLLILGWRGVGAEIKTLAHRHRRTWMAGRTHGIHAEPITFGFKLAGWHAEVLRGLERLNRARGLIAYGKLSGAVGSFAHLDYRYEQRVCGMLGLKAEPVSTQVVPRDRHADYFHALVLTAAAIERFATEIRHLQRTEVAELAEPFSEGQKGSSAMPHKRNPVLCENLCGLARLIRSYGAAVTEGVALWHERDISHSSVERVALPDAAILCDFMISRFRAVLDGLTVYPQRMRENLADSMGLVYSQKVLLTLIDAGLGRLEAYDIVQRNAMKTWKTREPFSRVLGSDPQVTRRLTSKALRSCFEESSFQAPLLAALKRGGID